MERLKTRQVKLHWSEIEQALKKELKLKKGEKLIGIHFNDKDGLLNYYEFHIAYVEKVS